MLSVRFSRASVVITSFTMSLGTVAFGDDTYSFGGACPSQGAWTQAALAQTKNITSVVEKLKDNPLCKGIESVAQDLGAAAEVLKYSDVKAQEASEVESLPGEIDALRKVMTSQGGLTAEIQNLLFKKTMTAASIGGKAAGSLDTPLNGSSAIRALYSRTKRATEYGIAATERVFKILPTFSQCLIGQPDQGMALMSAAVKVGASFASSGEGVGTRLGSAIASIVTMMRDKKFTLAMRKNHETEFWLSVSCLLETTTKNYCEAQEAQELLEYSHNEYLRSRKNAETGKVDPNLDNPLEGYYLLVRELPMIAQWLRGVKLGTTPKQSSDAAFQVTAIEKVNEMWKMDKKLRAYFAQEVQVMHGISDLNGRRNKLFSILSDLVSEMTGSDGVRASPAVDFFTDSMNTRQIPFYLVGMDEIPRACRATDDNINPKAWDQWMQSSGGKDGYISLFDDPDSLSKTIESRMNSMIESANEKAGIFFRKRLVIDLLNLVNKTLVGQNMTVRQALKHVDRYLERFENRLTDSYEDNVMRGSVKETRARIQKVLAAYDGLANYGKSLKSGKPMVDAHGKALDGDQAMLDGAKAVIDAVFTQLNVLYQSDVFLTNRLTTFIERDFAILVKKPNGQISSDQSQLLKIAQDHLVEKMIEVHGVNPTSAVNDLHIAQVVNIRNLQAVEQVFSDTIYVVLEELNEIAHGRPADAQAMRELMRKRFEKDRSLVRTLSLSLPSFGNPMTNLVSWLFAGHAVKSSHPELYERPSDVNSISSRDTAFKDFSGFRAQLCAQTLAFEGRSRFFEFCKGAVLKSFYSPEDQVTKLDLNYNSYLPNSAYSKAIQADPHKSSKAKCALSDYNIRNWVRLLEDRDRSDDGNE